MQLLSLLRAYGTPACALLVGSACVDGSSHGSPGEEVSTPTENTFDATARDDDASQTMDATKTVRDAGVDSGDARVAVARPRGEPPPAITEAKRRWSDLEKQHGGRYWYEREGCRWSSNVGQSGFVTVEDGIAQARGGRTHPRSECQQIVDSTGTSGGTFQELLDVCASVFAHYGAAKLTVDDATGMITSCIHVPVTRCNGDLCGYGYHIRRWGFGSLPESWEPYDDAGVRCTAYRATWRSFEGLDASVGSQSYALESCSSVTTMTADGGSECRSLSNRIIDELQPPLSNAWHFIGSIHGGIRVYPRNGDVTELQLRAPNPTPPQLLRIGTECAGTRCDDFPPDILELRALLRRISGDFEHYPRCDTAP